jgi:DNA modification methylase
MERIMIYNENCLTTLNRGLTYNYVFTGPADYSEIGMEPEDPKYFEFLTEVFHKLATQCPLVTVALTDRKYDCRIVSKHSKIIRIFEEMGWYLISHKIWHKSLKINLFRLNYSNIMTFSLKKKVKQNHPKEYEYDVFLTKEEKYKGFICGFPKDIVSHFINNFTQPGDVVYDPFMGSGTTAIAAIENGRNYLGSEIDGATYELSLERISEINNK